MYHLFPFNFNHNFTTPNLFTINFCISTNFCKLRVFLCSFFTPFSYVYVVFCSHVSLKFVSNFFTVVPMWTFYDSCIFLRVVDDSLFVSLYTLFNFEFLIGQVAILCECASTLLNILVEFRFSVYKTCLIPSSPCANYEF